MSDLCRSCGDKVRKTNAKNLYAANHHVLLQNLQLLTGLPLEKSPHMPFYICGTCEGKLDQAYSFRLQCIETENNFQKSIEYNSFTNENIDSDNYKIDPLSIKAENLLTLIEYGSIEENSTENNTETLSSDSTDLDIDTNEGDIKYDTNSSDSQEATNDSLHKKHMKKNCINWKSLSEEEFIQKKKEMRLKDLVCDQCGHHFTCQSNFKLHLLRHTGIKNYQCDICPQKFYTPNLLNQHKKIAHEGARPYACKYCDRTFNRTYARLLHERAHRNEKPHVCDTCGKAFIAKHDLKDHKIKHDTIPRFHCELCDQWFKRKRALMQHYKTKVHTENILKQKKNE